MIEPRLVEIDATAAQADQAALPPGAVVRPLTNGLERDSWPMLQLDLDAEKNGEIWAGLPRIPWLVAGRAKPGATVLAVAGGDDSAAVIAAQPYGLGKVLWVGTDGTWRCWRFRTGDRFHHRFWGQVALGGLRSDGGGQCKRAVRARQASLPRGGWREAPSADQRRHRRSRAELLIAARIYKVDGKTGAGRG